MPVLKNAKHEAFAQAVANGATAAAAYRKCISRDCLMETAETNGPRLARSAQLVHRISEIKEKSSQKAQMSRDEAVQICIDIIRSKPEEASMDNPLCELKMSKAGPFAAFPDKSRTMERLSKMLGWDAPEQVDGKLEIVIKTLG